MMRNVWVVVDSALSLIDVEAAIDEIGVGINRPIDQFDLLGQSVSITLDQFASKESPRLIAPTIEQAQRQREQVDLLIIIAGGCVFDVADWVNSSRIRRWLFVRTSDEPVQSQGLPECTPDQISATIQALDSVPKSRSPRPVASLTSPNVSLHWEFDVAGFPFVFVDPLDMFWQLFPVSKVQFEHHWLTQRKTYSNQWYADQLRLNPRNSPKQVTVTRYEQLFLTGLLSKETEQFADRNNFMLPTLSQWRTAYRWLETHPAILPSPDLTNLHPLAKAMWEQLYRHIRPKTLRELALMTGGVTEWVREGDGFVGLGKPRPTFHRALGNPLTGQPVRPIQSDQRIHHFGMRLMM